MYMYKTVIGITAVLATTTYLHAPTENNST